MPEEVLTYRSAGVDIDEAQRALRGVADRIRSTHGDGVIGGIGGFGGLFRASFPGMEQPILVSSIDGVGTKTKVAAMAGSFSGLGHDIVNHCVNDILCQGARPLFFLDYYGTSALSGLVFNEVLNGMAEACQAVGMALIGGETAEMPGVYHDDEIDVVGAIVGVVDLEKKLPRQKSKQGDALIGIASDGLHSNGYSLARRALFEYGGFSLRDPVPGLSTTIGDELLRPHRCYYNSVYPLIEEANGVYAVAHITGGGIHDNLIRVLPSDTQAVIERRSWTPLPIFQLIQEAGSIEESEMFRAFNMGIGMILVVDRDASAGVVQRLNQAGEAAAIIGYLGKGSQDVQVV
jgi:phosphoribosylformylglycinamidine cyclo-ligase